MDYEKMYHVLFNKITDIIEELKTVQLLTEEMYVSQSINNEKTEQENK